MSWNYRIIVVMDEDDDAEMSIHEVYYDDNNKPTSWSDEAFKLEAIAYSVDEAREHVEKILKAFDRPALIEDDDGGLETYQGT
jgi:hypothetical protein